MNIKTAIIVSSVLSLIVFVAFVIGMFFSGLTIFSGKYNYDALSALATLFVAIFGPLVSLIAAFLFYSSLLAQKESIKLQRDEFSEFVKSNDFNIQNINFSLVLKEIKEFNTDSSLRVENHYSSTTDEMLTKIDLINELKLHLINPGKAIKRSATILDGDIYETKEFIHCNVGDKIWYKDHKCEIVQRKEKEIKELERIERRFWIIFSTMYSLINTSNNKDIFKKVFTSILPYEYFEYSLGLFGKRGGHPDNQIIVELLDYYKHEIRNLT